MNEFFDKLLPRTPEYWHVVLNHFPIEGLAIATVVLAIGMLVKSDSVKRVGLFVIFVSSLSAWPVYWLGDEGYDRITPKVDDQGEAWLDEHEERAEKGIYVFSACAALALCALLLSFKSPRHFKTFTVLTLLSSIASLGAGAWIAYAGGKVMHKEFRLDGHAKTEKPDYKQSPESDE